MSLKEQCEEVYNSFHQTTDPEYAKVASTIRTVTANHRATFDLSAVIQPGTSLPPFVLPDATGTSISSSNLLDKGPLLINFYRGSWCPYCNLELGALQKLLPEFKKRNVTLVAISAELPDTTLDTKSKLELEFPVLSDVGNVFARQLGIVWKQPDVMKDLLAFTEWKKRYGTEEMEIAVAGTFLVDKAGVVRNVFVEPNWHERLEPQTALEWIDAL
ncbi:redoxin domain-containing protein [Stipitochalara longipes BDJ]|nr:redoxin domain-containing protein [Stipitochalara longipes BDJ]